MPAYSRHRFARALVRLLDRYPLPDVAQAAAREMIAQRWTHALDLFERDLARELLRERGHLEISLESARELPPRLTTEIAALLEKITKASSSTISLSLNPELLGGFRASSPAGELDASVKTKLNHLKQAT